jgi:hypothetical protein
MAHPDSSQAFNLGLRCVMLLEQWQALRATSQERYLTIVAAL